MCGCENPSIPGSGSINRTWNLLCSLPAPSLRSLSGSRGPTAKPSAAVHASEDILPAQDLMSQLHMGTSAENGKWCLHLYNAVHLEEVFYLFFGRPACTSAGHGPDTEIREKLLQPFLQATHVSEAMYTSSCHLLLVAVEHHPSLQGILLTGSRLQRTAETERVSP